MSEPRPPEASPPDDERASRDRRGMFHDTWELELLISGALVFGLLQLPPRISAWWDSASLHLSGDLRLAHFLVYYYLSLILYVLVTAFCLHIASRAYWVGIIGLRSVYPEGPDWSFFEKRGHHSVAWLKARVPTLDRMIRVADDFCSSIFAFAFLVIGMLVLSVAISVPIGLMAWLLKRTLLPDVDAILLGIGLFYLTVLPTMVGGLLDRRFGSRVAAGSAFARIIRFATGYAYWIVLGPINWPIMATFTSRGRRRLMWPLFLTASVVVFMMFTIDLAGRRGAGPRIESFSLYPEARTELTLDDAFYADRRDGSPSQARLPFIQSDVITGPYLRLFVPYYPNRDEELLREVCPDLGRFDDAAWIGSADEPGRPELEAALTCLESRFMMTLDGRPLENLDWLYARDGDAGARGTVAYVSLRDLAEGRHEIRLVRRMTAEEERDAREEIAGDDGDPDAIGSEELDMERTRYVIPFWR